VSQVAVWEGDLRSGQLPGVCCRTGAPADAQMRVAFSSAPGWIYLLILAGGLIFLIVYYAVAKRARGRLPVTLRERRRVGLLRLSPLLVILIALAMMIGSTAIPDTGTGGVVALFGLLLIVVAIVLALVIRRMIVRGKVFEDPSTKARWVELKGVHPAFAEAVNDFYRAGRPLAAPAMAATLPPTWHQGGVAG
jgi:hypothetical protein